jgi:hypothetical protein
MIDITFDASEIEKGLRAAEDNLDKYVPEAISLGGDMIAVRAKREHDYEDQTGILTNSIQSDGASGKFSSGNLRCDIGAGAPYAEFIEFGTKYHRVEPKHYKALRWPIEGGYAFSSGHWVSPIFPREFMADALENELDSIAEEVEAAAELSFRKAGF